MVEAQLTNTWQNLRGADCHETWRWERLLLIREGPVEEVKLELGFEVHLEFQQMNTDFLSKEAHDTFRELDI